MASKLLLPLAVGAGATLLLLSKKKTPAKAKAAKNGEQNVVDSGEKSGWSWRVKKESVEGFAARYFGEVKSPTSAAWTRVNKEGRPKPNEAKYLAWEYIAQKVSAKFNWEPARAYSETKLKESYPNASLNIIETGEMLREGVKCHWAIMSVLPPIEPGAYAGFIICPSTNEQISRFSDSIDAIKKELLIIA